MFRNRFVWETQVRREVVDDEITRLRDLPYSLWREMLTRPMIKMTRSRDEREYRIRTTAAWAHNGSENIRIEVVLESQTLHRRLISQSFVITPDNQFTE